MTDPVSAGFWLLFAVTIVYLLLVTLAVFPVTSMAVYTIGVLGGVCYQKVSGGFLNE